MTGGGVASPRKLGLASGLPAVPDGCLQWKTSSAAGAGDGQWAEFLRCFLVCIPIALGRNGSLAAGGRAEAMMPGCTAGHTRLGLTSSLLWGSLCFFLIS